MFLRLRSPSLNSCSIWKHILPPPPHPNPHHRFPSKETKIHLSHHQHQLSPRNPFPHVPVDMSDCYGEKKRSGEDEVDSCICSMHSSCWLVSEDVRGTGKETVLGETQCWHFRMLSSIQVLLSAGIVVEGVVEGSPACWKATRLKKQYSPSAWLWNNYPCFHKNAAERIRGSHRLDWASGGVCCARQAGTGVQALPSSRGIANNQALQTSHSSLEIRTVCTPVVSHQSPGASCSWHTLIWIYSCLECRRAWVSSVRLLSNRSSVSTRYSVKKAHYLSVASSFP